MLSRRKGWSGLEYVLLAEIGQRSQCTRHNKIHERMQLLEAVAHQGPAQANPTQRDLAQGRGGLGGGGFRTYVVIKPGCCARTERERAHRGPEVPVCSGRRWHGMHRPLILCISSNTSRSQGTVVSDLCAVRNSPYVVKTTST